MAARRTRTGRTRRRGRTITAAKRRSLRKSQFGLPGSCKYPVDTRRRAANAKQQLKRGRLSRSAYNRIVAKANRRLRRKG